jgi:hypothetical protein
MEEAPFEKSFSETYHENREKLIQIPRLLVFD